MAGYLQCFCNDLRKNEGFSGCYHKTFNISSYIPTSPMGLEPICKKWIIDQKLTHFLGFAPGVLTMLINIIILPFIYKLISITRLTTLSSLITITTFVCFIMQYFNTAIIPLLVSANSYPLLKTKFLNGPYSDFSYDWYDSVGINFESFMFS